MSLAHIKAILNEARDLGITLTNPENSDDSYTYTSHIVDVRDNLLEVYMPHEDHDAFLWIEQGDSFNCRVIMDDGLRLFRPIICRFDMKGTPSMIASLPNEVEHIQRRKHVRVSLNEEIMVNLAPNQSEINIAAETPVQAINISAGGLRILSPVALENEQVIHVRFSLDDIIDDDGPYREESSDEDSSKTEYLLHAKVIYCYAPNDVPSTKPILLPHFLKQKPTYITALQFVDMEPSIEKQLVQQCFQLEILHGKSYRR
jgi:c-di-GMP-binding flagellar brake protein YcgR